MAIEIKWPIHIIEKGGSFTAIPVGLGAVIGIGDTEYEALDNMLSEWHIYLKTVVVKNPLPNATFNLSLEHITFNVKQLDATV